MAEKDGNNERRYQYVLSKEGKLYWSSSDGLPNTGPHFDNCLAKLMFVKESEEDENIDRRHQYVLSKEGKLYWSSSDGLPNTGPHFDNCLAKLMFVKETPSATSSDNEGTDRHRPHSSQSCDECKRLGHSCGCK